MRSDRRLVAITHCHTVASSNRSSPMDAYIRAAVERVTGAPADDFDWSESLTTVEDLARILDGSSPHGRADLLLVTDHVNETTGGFDPDVVALAASEPRLAVGCELQTVIESPPGSGSFVDAPEVLIYGGPDRVGTSGGLYHGLTDEMLAEIVARCRPPGGARPELGRVLSWCREHRLAHALAHPLDGHFLRLEETLTAIASCRFVEVVNGGFSGDSARRLRRYLELCPGRHVPWGGSDAHLGRYDRVTVGYLPPAGPRAPGLAEMLRDMVDTSTSELLGESVFRVEGRGNDLLGCLDEVLRLIWGNARRNRETFQGLRRTSRLAVLGPWLGVRKVLAHRRHQALLGRELDAMLDRLGRERKVSGDRRVQESPPIDPKRCGPSSRRS